MIIYECDMCGRQSRSDMQTVEIVVPRVGAMYSPNVQRVMLCVDCGQKLVDYIHMRRKAAMEDAQK